MIGTIPTPVPMAMPTDRALLRLLQLSSATLPVGGYAFSNGLEWAVEEGWVSDLQSCRGWLADQLHHGLTHVELPLLRRAHSVAAEPEALRECNDLLLACRESREMRLAETAMGAALRQIMANLEVPLPLAATEEAGFVTCFAVVAAWWQIDLEATLHGYCWSWLESQVTAATKLIPLGQSQAQQLLSELQPAITAAIATSLQVADAEIGAGLPALAIASANHETQYTRLFRS